ncbi:hypothetical protein L9W97_17845 [Vibrio aestuarianus]|uniref:hypothetical protein n=1 Tax=Vibrio aestuarianus TaxID=28171 RepID=UPI00237C9E85|nr:hypothetical protein [Vibrio aestuarianus]MDE1326994.1 hypothetical protein [Vibrio aestuarianus]
MDSDNLGKSILESMGFDVITLEVKPNAKQADFLCSKSAQLYIVEAKLKVDDKVIVNERDDTLSRGEVFVSEGKQGRHEAVATIIRSIAHQLRATSKLYPDAFKLGLVISSGINVPTKSDNILDTIYGRTRIFDAETNSLKCCYFFYHSEFYRRAKDIDGIIEGIVKCDGSIHLQLCLNPYSKNYAQLRVSSLATILSASIVDPNEEEKLGNAYLPDHNIERSKRNELNLIPMYNPMNHHLSRKYGKKLLINVDFNTPEFSAQVP